MPFPLLSLQDQLYLNQGYEHHLKSELVATWSGWIETDMRNIRAHTRLDCHEVLKDDTSEKARWELTELDVQLVWGWARRELVILMMSVELEDILRVKMEACISEVTRVRRERQMGVWMLSDMESGRGKRLEQEREGAKKRMERAMREASQQADKEGRSWQDDPLDFLPRWKNVMDFIDQQWLTGINGRSEGLNRAEVALNRLILEGEQGRWSRDDRHGYVERLKSQVSQEHWRSQHQIEEELMKSILDRVRRLPANIARTDLDTAYEYPEPDTEATTKFAELLYSSSEGRACSALVYDALGCDKEAVCDVVAKDATRSVLNIDPEIVAFIPPNEHLLFLSCKDEKNVEPPFVQQNRDRWWSQQTSNSSTFYLTPWGIMGSDACYCNRTRIMAHILIFLTGPSVVRVRVLHHGGATKVCLQEDGEELGCISSIPSTFQLHEFRTFVLQPGTHELELVPQIDPKSGSIFDGYYLRDILIELLDNPSDNYASCQ